LQAPEARDSKPLERDEIEALVEALIEEARREQRRRRRRYWALAVLASFVGVVVLMLLDGGAASQNASSALSARSSVTAAAARSRIAFISTPTRFGRQIPGGLYVVNADGSGRRELTRAKYSTPAWSPDGRTLVFARSGQLYIVNADGSGEQNLTKGSGGAAAPAWSPDGSRIAFLRYQGTRFAWDLYVMNADGSKQQRLAQNARLAAPAWSPDGRKLAFVSDRDGASFWGEAREISVVNADGSGRRNLTGNPASDSDPAWSPDGRKIAFVSNFEIYVMNADGSGQQNLTRDPARDLAPAWSPDGKRIVFERRLGRQEYGGCPGCGRASIFEVHVMNADGNGQRRLTRDVTRGGESIGSSRPRWSPDGRQIAFVGQRDGTAEVYVMNADGSDRRNLTRNPRGHDNVFAWSPARK
jgi:Tol biopolymer transport system component